jgi:hypothetical protein
VRETLVSLRVPPATADKLARSWIKVGDFLEASLCFPIADFVIGNPPYIRLEEIPEKKAAMYRNGFSAMHGRADIYVAFYQAALLQLKPRGVCAYICADRWMLNDYGSALREFITIEGYNVRHIIEAHDVQAFESEVSAYPAVTIIAREEQGPVIVSKALPGIETENRQRSLYIMHPGPVNRGVELGDVVMDYERSLINAPPFPALRSGPTAVSGASRQKYSIDRGGDRYRGGLTGNPCWFSVPRAMRSND